MTKAYLARLGAVIAGYRRSRIGALSWWLDPETPGYKLEAAIDMHPDALENPSMPPNALVESAYAWPEYVENNPVLSLIALEEPATFEEIVKNIKEGWSSSLQMAKLSLVHQRRLAIDFCKRLVPLWRDEGFYEVESIDFLGKVLSYGEALLYKTQGNLRQHARYMARIKNLLEELPLYNGRNFLKGFQRFALQSLRDALAWIGTAEKTQIQTVGTQVQTAMYCYAKATGASDDEAREAERAEGDTQAALIKKLFYEEETLKEINRQLGSKFREMFYGDATEEERQKKYRLNKLAEYELDQAERKFIAKNKELGKGIAKKLAETRGGSWAPWLLLGIVAGSIVIVIAGEALAVAGAAAIAEEVAAYAAAADVSTVSVEQLLTAAEMSQVEANLFFNALKEKLTRAGLTVVKTAADAVVKVTR